MAAEVVQLKSRETNPDAIALVEGLLARLRSGEAVAVAFVEVCRGQLVATEYDCGREYHALNSGAARLAHRLASVEDSE